MTRLFISMWAWWNDVSVVFQNSGKLAIVSVVRGEYVGAFSCSIARPTPFKHLARQLRFQLRKKEEAMQILRRGA